MHYICNHNDIDEGQSKGFEINGNTVFCVKKDGQLYGYINRCPHLGVELEWQEDQFLNPDKDYIQCNVHGALFTIEQGECVSGPCQGDYLTSISLTRKNDGWYIVGNDSNQ